MSIRDSNTQTISRLKIAERVVPADNMASSVSEVSDFKKESTSR